MGPSSSLAGRSRLLHLLLLMVSDLVGSLVVLALGLLDEVGDRSLEVVDAPAHLVDPRDDVVAHRLETRLHLGQHLLHQLSQLIG